MEVLRRHTVYLGWTEHHEVVERFWRVMSQLTDKDRSQFLRFAWGRSRLPKEDPWPRPFKLTYKNAGDEMLPIAHTCFFQLELPQYTTDKIMHDRLLVAINYGVSGEFMLRWIVCYGKSIHFICDMIIHFICGMIIHSLWHEYPLSLLCRYPYPLHSSHPRFPPILPLFKHPTMGIILDKPVVDKEVTLFSQSEHKGAVVSMQGYRVSMEVDLSLQSVYAIGRVCCCAVDGG